uniref:Ig-like domain-containing protein n=1 Tax=Photinus pyralis TaxID=7054 RepID=A0A1Y1NHK7_PHOPY
MAKIYTPNSKSVHGISSTQFCYNFISLMGLSDRKKVVLRTVNLKSSGLYRCEVSAEAPSFSSAQSEARMEVVYLPKEDPVITGVELQYQIGDEINLNCTSGKSHPAPVLHWYINEQQVPLHFVQ